MRLYSGMSRAMNKICAGYDDTELALIADFLRRSADAGASASANLLEGLSQEVCRHERKRSSCHQREAER